MKAQRQEAHYVCKVRKGEKMGDWYWMKLETWIWVRTCRALENMIINLRLYSQGNVNLLRSIKQGNKVIQFVFAKDYPGK